jgi:hypothetical protein
MSQGEVLEDQLAAGAQATGYVEELEGDDPVPPE